MESSYYPHLPRSIIPFFYNLQMGWNPSRAKGLDELASF